MIDLDDKTLISSIDKKDAYSSVKNLPNQCRQAWEETQKINFPDNYKSVSNVVLCGMGGSAYAGLMIKALYQSVLNVPFDLVNGYDLPKYVNEDTLVLLSTYSGTTEEVLACAEESLKRNAKITAVCNGSTLEEFINSNNLPAYIFDAKFNPAQQPRLGQGYMILGHIGILNKIGIIDLNVNEVSEAIEFIDKNTDEIENLAKQLAKRLIEKIPIIVASAHLSANAHIIRNQINENSKNFATYSIIPELNHHLMEGLAHPKDKILEFILLKSSLYSSSIKKRFELTKDVIEKNGVKAYDVEIKGENIHQQMLYALSLGGFLSFYLAILYEIDPSPIPWVDYFKKQLKS